MTWRTISSKVVYRNPWIAVREDQVVRPDGSPGLYGVVETTPSVFIVALSDADEVLLVTQDRYPTGTSSVEVPAGNAGHEEPLAAAARELQEETGYAAARWTPIGVLESMNGICTELQHVFLARELTHVGTDAQAEDGITDVQWVPLDDVLERIRDGAITDGQSVSSLLLALLALGVLNPT
jgi:8-oxo-dGTP pyrophosphatase MutT (NUDIX family)